MRFESFTSAPPLAIAAIFLALGGCMDGTPPTAVISQPLRPLEPQLAIEPAGSVLPMDLGPEGADFAEAVRVNDFGQAAILDFTTLPTRALLWDSGVLHPIDVPDENPSIVDLNDAGAVLLEGFDVGPEGYLWQDGTLLRAFDSGLRPADLNNHGHVVLHDLSTHGFWLWDGLSFHLIPLPGPGQVIGINDAGTVLGSYRDAENKPVNFLWHAGVRYDVPEIGGNPTSAVALNEADQATGFFVDLTTSERVGVIWSFDSATGQITVAQTIPGLIPRKLNDRGHVAGLSTGGEILFWDGSSLHPVATKEDGVVLADLNNVDQVLLGANPKISTADRSYLWMNGTYKELLPAVTISDGTKAGADLAARDLNDLGHVVGWSIVNLDLYVHAAMWRMLTPAEQVASVVRTIEDLVATGALDGNKASGLLAKLNVVIALLNDAKAAPAAHVLEAFIQHVENLVQQGRLTAANAELILDAARMALGELTAA